jgi:hypothetical protein
MYKILKVYDIGNYVDQMWILQKDLELFLQEKFSDHPIEFDSTDRILFYHSDVDFFIKKDFPGFALYNLQLILRELNIPNFVCAIQTNMPGYDYYTKLVRDILCPNEVPIRAISISSEIVYAKELPNSIETNINNIEYPFVVLSRLSRSHRTLFMSKLFESQLQNVGLVSYHNIDMQCDIRHETRITRSDPIPTWPVFLSTVPFSMYNHEYVLSADSRKLLSDFISSVPSYCNFTEDTDVSIKNVAMNYHCTPIQQSLIYVALETVAIYPTAYQSGISFKSIAQKRPFLIFGSTGCIKLLQDQGFQTFDRWWNEDYDNESDIERRLNKIITILKELSLLNSTQLRSLCHEMESVLEHNYRHFVGRFIDNELSKKHNILEQQFISHD